ncbi:MAG TPA: DUF1048 domain-containing protein [Micromonosporaceae bacterium]|jgi:DNA-binding ferritin-like protein (Dps family)
MFLEKVIGDLGDKRRWRQYKARTRQLPPNYRMAIEAVEHYLMYLGPGSGDVSMFEDLIDLFERAAADGTPIRSIVGDDPVEFVEAFKENYAKGGWIMRERSRLTDAIARAAGEATQTSEGGDR